MYKPMLKCFGENLTIVIGGVFRTLGFVGSSSGHVLLKTVVT